MEGDPSLIEERKGGKEGRKGREERKGGKEGRKGRGGRKEG